MYGFSEFKGLMKVNGNSNDFKTPKFNWTYEIVLRVPA